MHLRFTHEAEKSRRHHMESAPTTSMATKTACPKRVKHPRRCPTDSRKHDVVWALGEDIVTVMATFASCRDLCTLSCVSKRFAMLSGCESLWELRALDMLPSREQLHSAMAMLHLVSYRQVVEAFNRIGIPCGVLGFWRADLSVEHSPHDRAGPPSPLRNALPKPTREPTDETSTCGELLRISLVAGGFLCESIAPDGTSNSVFTIRVSTTVNDKVVVGFFANKRRLTSTMGGSGWVPGQSIDEAFLRRAVAVPRAEGRTPIHPCGENAFLFEHGGAAGATSRYIKLKAPSPSPPWARSATGGFGRNWRVQVAHGLCGLWCGPYGCHGLKIIQLAVEPPETDAEVSSVLARSGLTTAGSPKRRRTSRSGSTCSSSKTISSGSACTSAPATDGTNSRCAGSCSSSGSDGSDDEDDEGRSTPMSKRRSSPLRPDTRKRSAYGRDGAEDMVSSDEDNGEDEVTMRDGEAQMRNGARKQNEAPASVAPAALYGVKLMGDANVPAGKTSFAIDLDTECDVDEELDIDRRPVILFLPSGAVMANLANRRGQIAFWCRGRGRINRIPGRWASEWVDVDFVAYHPGSRCGFSVVLRQPAQAMRVIMDFERPLGCKEEWPKWPILSSAA